MTFRNALCAMVAVLLTSQVIGSAYAQEEISLDDVAGMIAPFGLDSLDVVERFKEEFRKPETLNKVLQKFVETGTRWQILRELHLQFKTFNADNGGATGLGLSYQYDKDIKREMLSEKTASQSGLAFSFDAEGNLAFDRALNPRDFLETGLNFKFFRSSGGALQTTAAVRDRLNALEDILTEATEERVLFQSDEWNEFLSTMQANMTTQAYWDVAASLAYEANQDFSTTQTVYGGHLGLDIKAWNDTSRLAQWNIFDWPAALVRLLDGVDEEFTPRGSTIPTLLVGIDWVDPSENPTREALGEMDSYPRALLETAYKSLIAEHGNQEVFWLIDLRYYSELGPPDAIKLVDQDEFLYFVTAVTIGESLFVSYSDGQLPFDAARDKVYELGFRLAF